MAFTFIKGKPTKVHIGLLTPNQQAASPIVAPADQTVTLGAAVAADATSLTVTALTAGIARGTALKFTSGADFLVVYVAAHAEIGATTITIDPSGGAIDTGATAAHKGLICLNGLTSANFQISSTDTATDVFDCTEIGDTPETTALGGFADGLITAASWSMPLNGNVLPGDLGYIRLAAAGQQALLGAKAYVRLESDVPPGFSTGQIREGVVQVADFNESYEATGLVTISATLNGRGDPKVTPPLSI